MRIELLIVLSSLVACGTSQDVVATTPSSKPVASAQPATCDGGDIILQIDRKSIHRSPDPTVSSITIRSSGAWTFDDLDDDKLVRKQGGCLAAADVAKMRTALDAAPWQLTHPVAVCEIAIVVRTEYRVNGRHVWTAMGCAGASLDDKSQAALDSALALVPLVKSSR
jgi:hypothetical protein